MARQLDGAIAELALKTLGLLTQPQLDRVGVTRQQRRTLIAQGVLIPVGGGVLRHAAHAPSWLQRLLAAVLVAGEGAVASHLAAAALWQFDGIEPGAVEITVPHARRPRVVPATVHRSRHLGPADVDLQGRIPRTSATRTLLDIAPLLDSRRLEAALDGAERDGTIWRPRLRWHIGELRDAGHLRRPGMQAVERLLDHTDARPVGDSWLETLRTGSSVSSVQGARPGHPQALQDRWGRSLANRVVGGAPVGRHSASTGAYSVRTITEQDELEALSEPWHRLLLVSPTATAFVSPAWVLAWYRAFERSRGVYVVTVWRDGDLVGVAPFARTRIGGTRAGFTLLVSAGTEHGDYGDPLLGADPLPVAHTLADHLACLTRRENTVVNLRRLHDESPLLALLEARDDVACEPMGTHADNAVVRFSDMDDPEATLARLARKRDLPRLRRRLTEHHGEVVFTSEATDTAAALDAMRDLLARRWAPGEGPRMFATPARDAFTREVTAALIDCGLARVSTLTAGGRIVAVTINYRVGDREIGDATGSEPDLRKYAVGLMHLHEVLTSAWADGVGEVDMRAGDFPYKDQWATTSQGTRSIAVRRAGRLGPAQLALRRGAMSVRARRITRREQRHP